MSKTVTTALIMTMILAAACAPPEEERRSAAYEAMKQKAENAFSDGSPRLAIQFIARAVAARPDLRDGYELASNYHLAIPADEDAVQFFKLAAEMNPDIPWPWYFKGYHEYRLKQPAMALGSLVQAVELEPEDPQINLYLGLVYDTTGNDAKALEHLQTAAALDPDSGFIAAQLAMALMKDGRLEEAEMAALEALNMAPTEPSLFHALGRIYGAAKIYSKAELMYSRAIGLDPEEPVFRNELIEILETQGRQDEADVQRLVLERTTGYHRGVQALAGAAVADLNNPGPCMALAELELTENNLEKAVQWFERARSAGGDEDRIAAGMAETRFKMGDTASGDTELSRVVDTGHPRVALARSARFATMGDKDQAIRFLRAAMADPPDEREFLLRLSDHALLLEENQAAEQLVKRAVRAPSIAEPGK